MDTSQDVLLHLGGEIDQHVAAEDDIEPAEHRVAVEQIELAKIDSAAYRHLHCPAAWLLLIAIAPQSVLRQPSAHRQAVVLGPPRCPQPVAGYLGGDDLRPTTQLAGIGPLVLVYGHTPRIGFLP